MLPHLLREHGIWKCFAFLGHISLLVCLCRTHCNAQIMSQKELCDERVATAKLELEKKMKEFSTSLDKSPQVRRHLFIRRRVDPAWSRRCLLLKGSMGCFWSAQYWKDIEEWLIIMVVWNQLKLQQLERDYQTDKGQFLISEALVSWITLTQISNPMEKYRKLTCGTTKCGVIVPLKMNSFKGKLN